MIAALICGVLGLSLALALDGWVLIIPLGFALLGFWLLAGGGERWLARRETSRESDVT